MNRIWPLWHHFWRVIYCLFLLLQLLDRQHKTTKCGIISECFSFLGSNLPKMCQITILSSIHLKRRCSGWCLAQLLGDYVIGTNVKNFLRLSRLYRDSQKLIIEYKNIYFDIDQIQLSLFNKTNAFFASIVCPRNWGTTYLTDPTRNMMFVESIAFITLTHVFKCQLPYVFMRQLPFTNRVYGD